MGKEGSENGSGLAVATVATVASCGKPPVVGNLSLEVTSVAQTSKKYIQCTNIQQNIQEPRATKNAHS